jgi:hypothetical protein
MALSYISVQETDFSKGIDARSAENQIAPGFAKDLLNADIVEKRPRTRKGYQGFAGNIPVRVSRLQYVASTHQMYLTLDSAASGAADVDLNSIRSSPLVIYGRSSTVASGGPITTADSVHYYSAFTVPTRRTFLATSAAPPYESLLIPETEHGITTTNMFVTTVESTSTVDRSYSSALPHTTVIAEGNEDITVSYQNSTGSNRDVYTFYKDQTAATGSSYIQLLAHAGGGAQTFTITAATHALANFNIIAQVQQDTGTDREFVSPDLVTIASNGDVALTLTSTSAASFYAILAAAPVTNQVTGNVNGMATGTIQITGLTSPWIFTGIYLQLTAGGTKERVVPDSLVFDDVSSTLTITFTNQAAAARNFVAFYDYGTIRSNQLAITDASISVDATDTAPQVTIWGLDHTEIYSADATDRPGWVTHIDSYRSAGERRLISGLGGNLFSARTYDEAGAKYDYALLYPNLQARTNAARTVGPVFYSTGDTPARARGYVLGDNSGTGWASVSAVTYNAGTGNTTYTLSVPNMAILDSSGTPTTIGSVISTAAGLNDWLTVTNMSYARHNGTFRIESATSGTNTITLEVSGVVGGSADYNDANTSGSAGVFTDQFNWLTTAPFLPGDVLSSAAISDSLICTVLSSYGTMSVVGGLVDRLQLAGGVLTSGSRSSSVIPMRLSQPLATASTTNVVRGDMLDYLNSDAAWDGRKLRVLYVNSDTDRAVTLSSTAGIGTAVLSTGDTSFLALNRKVALSAAGDYTGVITVLDILNSTSFTFATEATGAATGSLVGQTIEVDEELDWSDTTNDGNAFEVSERWIPIESPDDAYDLTPSTHVRYFDSGSYGNQPFLRSTMVQNNMYLLNGQDETYKFDGVNNYRAGLFSWQPGLFVTQDTAPTAKIVISNRTVSYTAISASGGYITIAYKDQSVLPVGADVRLTGSTVTYTVRHVAADATTLTTAYVYFDKALDGTVAATGTMSELATFRYYFRLNAIDANDNVVASAVTGYQDHVVQLSANAAVHLKLVGMPAWDVYDYTRLEVEIYRTKQNTPAPFYRAVTVQMDFDNTQGYVEYTDTFADIDLIELDSVSTALKGTELGLSWQEPLRAKYITSIGNSLVQAYLRDYPQLDIQLIASGAVTNATFAGKRFLFRRDDTDTGTATNNTARIAYEFVNGTTNTAGTFATLSDKFTFVATGLPGTVAIGDWIYLSYSTVATSARDLQYCGWWQVAGVTGTTITINLVGAVAPTATPDKYTIATASKDVPVLLGVDGNLGQVNGDSFDLFDTMRRMSMALNASMRMVDTSITGQSGFTPWMVSRGGNDVAKAGRLIVRQPRSDSPVFSVLLPSTFSGSGQSFQAFVNDTRRLPSTSVSSTVRLYPSRIAVSYENYPEIFDNPTAVLDSDSDSVIDINSADGQEITGVIPFFGSATFTSAQQAAILVVFKTNSIYLVDINEKRAGRNPIQRIETEGLGCTAPYSIAVTKNGVMFANESGIYCLRKTQSIDYIGRFMERKWTEQVNLQALDLVQGHHYGVGRVYKLSLPLVGSVSNSEVYTYNHTGEDQGATVLAAAGTGAWTRYNNHPATGWANLGSDAFFASSLGRVFSLRDTGTETDARDDSSPITFRLDTRAIDFGNPGIRKVVDATVVAYRTEAPVTSAKFQYAVDLATEYSDSTGIVLRTDDGTTGIDDVPGQDILSVRHKTDRRKGIYFQVRVECSSLDEHLEVAGLSLKVGGMSERGVRQAAQAK